MTAMIDRLETMLAEGRDDAMLRFGLGSALFNEKRYDEAVQHLEECIRQNEGYSAAYKLLGRSLMNLKSYPDAKEVLAKGLRVAESQGDKQSEKEITVFLKKIEKSLESEE